MTHAGALAITGVVLFIAAAIFGLIGDEQDWKGVLFLSLGLFIIACLSEIGAAWWWAA